jgi:predicted AlkP superfamily pyrophosphatase or phosphodiesterase
MKTCLIPVIVIIQLLCGSAAGENLIMMGWDGAGLNNVNVMLKEGKLPNLAALLNNGAHLVPLEVIANTVTQSSWTQAFTGLTYDQTGVLGNGNFAIRYGEKFSTEFSKGAQVFNGLNFYIRRVPFEHTIVKAIKEKDIKIGWFSAKQLGALDDIRYNADKSQIAMGSTKGDNYLSILSDGVIRFISGKRDYFLFFLTSPDYYGHIYGENGDRYLQEIVRSDEALGIIMQHLDREKTRVIVIADHGFDENKKSHYNAPDSWMVTDLPIHSAYWLQEKQRAFGTVRDVAPTILEWYGIDYKSRVPQIRGKSLLE